MKDNMETTPHPSCCDEHALENQDSKDGISGLKPYESAGTHSKSPDNRLDYSIHGHDQNMPHFPLEKPVPDLEDTRPIQCTEDYPQRDADVYSYIDKDCHQRDAEISSCRDQYCLQSGTVVYSRMDDDCLQRDADINSCKDEDCLQRDDEVNSCMDQDCLHRSTEVNSCKDEDCLHGGTEINSCKEEPEGPQQSQVNTCNQDDVDLPNSVSEAPLSEGNDHHDKKPRLKCVVRPEKLVDRKDLKLKYTADESTTRKQFKSNPMGIVEADPLDVKPFLKPLSRNQPVVTVYMLRGFTPQVSSQSSKQSNDDEPFPNYYHSDLNRLATYIGYPSDIKIFAILLARDGFIFRQSEQSIQCWFCKLSISLSELRMPDANPVKMHGDRCPQCPQKKKESREAEPVPQRDDNSRMHNSPSLGSQIADNGINVGSHNADSGINSVSKLSLTTDSPEEERSAPVLFHGDGATVQPSPVIQHPPALNTSKDIMTRTPQEQTPRQQPNLPQNTSSAGVDGTAASLQRSDGATAQVSTNTSSNGDSRNRPSSSASSSGQQAESPTGSEQAQASSSAASNSAKNPKPTKKTKAARRAEARRASSASGASAPSTSAPAQTAAKKGEQNKDKKKLTYADLGIYAEKPKRPDMAALQKRLSTYAGKWQASFAKTPQTLAECGMYYAGYNDCARCFFCGGGLKNWETGDEPWVEHARWFPKCAYLLLCKGQPFVDIVQTKNDKNEKIVMKDIEDEIRRKTQAAEMTTVSLPIPSGGDMADGTSLSAPSVAVKDVKELEKENEDLNADMACKICMDERSSMVFLPCGHMVACTDCAVVLKNCPLCRAEIRGTVKAQMDF